MSRKVTISAIQLPDYHGEGTPQQRRDYNVEVAIGMLQEAGERGSDIACLPEVFPVVGAAETAEDCRRLAEEEGGELSKRLCELAREFRMNIIAPVLGLYGGVLRNVAWVISGSGEYIDCYFKVHCTRNERERGVLPGDDWPVFWLDFGTVGVMICHDNSFPESARCLTLNLHSAPP